MSLPSGVTGHLGTPMKETGGLSQPPRSLNHPNKQNKTKNKHSRDTGPKSPVIDMRLARVPCASPPRAMRDSARPGATARPGRARRRGAASNPRRKRPPRREERADPVVAKVYMYAPVAVDRECAGRHPRHHAQVHVRLATCTATPASVPCTEDSSLGSGKSLRGTFHTCTCVARRSAGYVSVGTSSIHEHGPPTAD